MNLIDLIPYFLSVLLGFLLGYVIKPYTTRKAENQAEKESVTAMTRLRLVGEDQNEILKVIKTKAANINEMTSKILPKKYQEPEEDQQKKDLFIGELLIALLEFNNLINYNKGLFPKFFEKGGRKISDLVRNEVVLYVDHDPEPPFPPDFKKYWSLHVDNQMQLSKATEQYLIEIDAFRLSTKRF